MKRPSSRTVSSGARSFRVEDVPVEEQNAPDEVIRDPELIEQSLTQAFGPVSAEEIIRVVSEEASGVLAQAGLDAFSHREPLELDDCQVGTSVFWARVLLKHAQSLKFALVRGDTGEAVFEAFQVGRQLVYLEEQTLRPLGSPRTLAALAERDLTGC